VNRERSRGQDRRSGQERREDAGRVSDRKNDADRRAVAERRNDADRRAVAERRVALDRVQDQAQIEQLANQWRTMERDHPQWSHAFQRHVDINDEQLARRAATGELPGGGHGERPANATRWQSADAMVIATHGLANSPEYRAKLASAEANGTVRFTVTRPLPEVLGPAWRADVYGRTAASGGNQASQWHADGVAVGTWQRRSDGRWHPLTCYPQPGALRSRTAGGWPS
jgi:hypothetical protein